MIVSLIIFFLFKSMEKKIRKKQIFNERMRCIVLKEPKKLKIKGFQKI